MVTRKTNTTEGQTAVTRTPVAAAPKTERHFADLRIVFPEGTTLEQARASADNIAEIVQTRYSTVDDVRVVQVDHVDARPRGLDPVQP